MRTPQLVTDKFDALVDEKLNLETSKYEYKPLEFFELKLKYYADSAMKSILSPNNEDLCEYFEPTLVDSQIVKLDQLNKLLLNVTTNHNFFLFDKNTQLYIYYYLIANGHEDILHKCVAQSPLSSHQTLIESPFNYFSGEFNSEENKFSKQDAKFLLMSLILSRSFDVSKSLSSYCLEYGLDIDLLAFFFENSSVDDFDFSVEVIYEGNVFKSLGEILSYYFDKYLAGEVVDTNRDIIYNLVAKYSLKVNDYEFAQKIYSELLSKGFNSNYDLGTTLVKLGKYKEAESYLLTALKKGDNNAYIGLIEFNLELRKLSKQSGNIQLADGCLENIYNYIQIAEEKGLDILQLKYKFMKTVNNSFDIIHNDEVFNSLMHVFDNLIISGLYKYDPSDSELIKNYISYYKLAKSTGTKSEKLYHLRKLAFDINHPEYQLKYIKLLYSLINTTTKGITKTSSPEISKNKLKLGIAFLEELIKIHEHTNDILKKHELIQARIYLNKNTTDGFLEAFRIVFKYEENIIGKLCEDDKVRPEVLEYTKLIVSKTGITYLESHYDDINGRIVTKKNCGTSIHISDYQNSSTGAKKERNYFDKGEFLQNAQTGAITKVISTDLGNSLKSKDFYNRDLLYPYYQNITSNYKKNPDFSPNYNEQLTLFNQDAQYFNKYVVDYVLLGHPLIEFLKFISKSNLLSNLTHTTLKLIIARAYFENNISVYVTTLSYYIEVYMDEVEDDLLSSYVETYLKYGNNIPAEFHIFKYDFIVLICEKMIELYSNSEKKSNKIKKEIALISSWLGDIYFKDGNYEKSIEYFTLGVSYGDLYSHERLGDCYHKQDNYQMALDTYMSLFTKHKIPSVAYKISLIYKETGNFAKEEYYLVLAYNLGSKDVHSSILDFYYRYITSIVDFSSANFEDLISVPDMPEVQKKFIKDTTVELADKVEFIQKKSQMFLTKFVLSGNYKFDLKYQELYRDVLDEIDHIEYSKEVLKTFKKIEYSLLGFMNTTLWSLKRKAGFEFGDIYCQLEYVQLLKKASEIYSKDKKEYADNDFYNQFIDFMDHLAIDHGVHTGVKSFIESEVALIGGLITKGLDINPLIISIIREIGKLLGSTRIVTTYII